MKNKNKKEKSNKKTKTALDIWEALKSNAIYRKIRLGLFFYFLDEEEYEEISTISVGLASPKKDCENYSFNFGSIDNLIQKTDYANIRWNLSYASSFFRI